MLFGLLFFVPLLGPAVGAGLGALTGSMADVGIDDGFINQVSVGTTLMPSRKEGGTAMSEQRTEVTGWVGWVWYAAIMLMIVGGFDLVQGIIVLADDNFSTGVSGGLLVFNATTWGWVHVIAGAIMLITGIGLWSGQGWARVVAVIVAALNALVQFSIMPAYPFWAVLMVALNIVVIYAVVVHGREARLV